MSKIYYIYGIYKNLKMIRFINLSMVAIQLIIFRISLESLEKTNESRTRGCRFRLVDTSKVENNSDLVSTRLRLVGITNCE